MREKINIKVHVHHQYQIVYAYGFIIVYSVYLLYASICYYYRKSSFIIIS